MSWNKGFTKLTHPSVLKISETMRKKKIDNFLLWRNKMKELGKIKGDYPAFIPSGDLAEFIGVMLGDGNISAFPRTERLILVSNSNNRGFIDRYAMLVEKIFNKKPGVYSVKNVNAVRITLYQKNISQRLQIPAGNRGKINNIIPSWIVENKDFLIRFLRGLFEAEGSLSIHLKTCTYNFQFKNNNTSLLKIVADSLILLGFNPEIRYNSTRLRRRAEVLQFKELIKFREY